MENPNISATDPNLPNSKLNSDNNMKLNDGNFNDAEAEAVKVRIHSHMLRPHCEKKGVPPLRERSVLL